MIRPVRLRAALLAVALACVGLPALASASPADCVPGGTPELGDALCLVVEGGRAVQELERPLVGPRDAIRMAGESALAAAGMCGLDDRAHCLLPFPNDRWTIADASTATGLRVSLPHAAMPRNVAGKPIDPTELNRNDGFSPGTPMLTSVPNLDAARSRLAGVRDPGASLTRDARIVLLDAKTGKRHPYIAELDANPTDGQQPLLIIRPMVNLTEGHRYVVALRNLVDGAGKTIPASPSFAARRDQAARDLSTKPDAVRADRVWGPLVRARVPLGDLFLAWTFTVASTRNLTERMLHMRDDAFASLQGGAPKFTVDRISDPDGDPITRRITGTFTVPNYLTTPVNAKDPVAGFDVALPGTRLLYLPGDELPDRNGDFTATYTCNVPSSVLKTAASPAPARAARAAIYGHGLLGGQGEVNSGHVARMGEDAAMLFCATDWYGMATGDVPNVVTFLADMSAFPTLPDRVQQGMLAHLFLARLLKDPRGFASNPAFQAGGRSLHRTGEVYYDGNSQGGIIGGALMAVSQDITRGVLGVPGMNYSTLLDRSVDFEQYEAIFNAAYPSELERQLIFGLIQMLWDRGETNGYAAHISRDPLPGTPRHEVLLHVGFGDHQVAQLSAEVMARTIGAATNTGFLRRGRHSGRQPGWAIPRFSRAHAGSAIVYWDSGSPTPPDTNTPPFLGRDSHEDPRRTYFARAQKSAFLKPRGLVIDTCRGRPCLARPLGSETGPPLY
ncbi:MAG TPA: hypothetical protein VNB94_00120 [Mycobacteriales bacterium]|nr:hypothetical protein [Mycobacteriales bacterium]